MYYFLPHRQRDMEHRALLRDGDVLRRKRVGQPRTCCAFLRGPKQSFFRMLLPPLFCPLVSSGTIFRTVLSAIFQVALRIISNPSRGAFSVFLSLLSQRFHTGVSHMSLRLSRGAWA